MFDRRPSAMLDLGPSFLASVARDPQALAIVDGEVRLTYAAWLPAHLGAARRLRAHGAWGGDHLVTALQNRWEAATLHWACQFAGIVITPVNWRSTASETRLLPRRRRGQGDRLRGGVGCQPLPARPMRKGCRGSQSIPGRLRDIAFAALASRSAPDAVARADAEAWSVMLYTSGTTARPKGVPRRQRAERAAAVAHVAQNLYGRGERTLGVMPLYHTMGVRSLLAMSLVGGAFVCLRRFDVGEALATDRRRARDQPLSRADALSRPGPSPAVRGDRRELGAQARLRRRADDRRPAARSCRPRSSPTCSSIITARRRSTPSPSSRTPRPSRARPAAPASTRWSAWWSSAPHRSTMLAAAGEEGEIIALSPATNRSRAIGGGRKPTPRRCAQGWYFTGDTGYVDADGDLSSPAASTT